MGAGDGGLASFGARVCCWCGALVLPMVVASWVPCGSCCCGLILLRRCLPASAGIPLLCAHINLSPEADPTAVLHEVRG